MKFKHSAHAITNEVPGEDVPVTEVQLEAKPLFPKLHFVNSPINASEKCNVIMFEICRKCRKPIGLDCREGETRITLIPECNQHLHSRCFTCASCKLYLGSRPGQRFYANSGDSFLCDVCMDRCYSDVCTRCNKEIRRYTNGELQLSSMDGARHWHNSCYACYKCNRSLRTGAGVYGHQTAEGIFCRECFDEINTNVCNVCKKRVLRYSRGEKLISSSDGTLHWHHRCYHCKNCRLSLLQLGGYYRYKDGAMYCEDCCDQLNLH